AQLRSDPADKNPPTVSMTARSSGSTVKGTVTVSADAADNVGVVGVQFKVDGQNLGTERKSPPFTVSWDTTTVANGVHTLTAIARDASGNTGVAAPVTVTVNDPDRTPPAVTITSPTPAPTYTTSTPLLTLEGITTADTAVAEVTWANSRGGTGTAS